MMINVATAVSPGATLLAGHSDYETNAELPSVRTSTCYHILEQ